MDYIKDFETHFQPLQLIEDYNPQDIDPEYEKHPDWDDELFDKENLQFRHDDDPEIKDNKLSRALIDVWQPNSEANNPEETEKLQRQEVHQATNSVLDEKASLHVLVIKEGEPAYIPPQQTMVLYLNYGCYTSRWTLGN